jgi:hypothetical protein
MVTHQIDSPPNALASMNAPEWAFTQSLPLEFECTNSGFYCARAWLFSFSFDPIDTQNDQAWNLDARVQQMKGLAQDLLPDSLQPEDSTIRRQAGSLGATSATGHARHLHRPTICHRPEGQSVAGELEAPESSAR